jgi:GNAT superfamily N-acetyltransferase
MPEIAIRPARPDDAATVVTLVRELAVYEREPLSSVKLGEADILRDGFGAERRFELLLATLDGVVEGFALFFPNYSTFLGKPGLYLEDLFVRPEYRGQGLGLALMKRLAQIAVERGCGRFEWSVLDWNEPAIAFYKKLGARPMDEWTIFRVTGDALTRLAAQAV